MRVRFAKAGFYPLQERAAFKVHEYTPRAGATRTAQLRVPRYNRAGDTEAKTQSASENSRERSLAVSEFPPPGQAASKPKNLVFYFSSRYPTGAPNHVTVFRNVRSGAPLALVLQLSLQPAGQAPLPTKKKKKKPPTFQR